MVRAPLLLLVATARHLIGSLPCASLLHHPSAVALLISSFPIILGSPPLSQNLAEPVALLYDQHLLDFSVAAILGTLIFSLIALALPSLHSILHLVRRRLLPLLPLLLLFCLVRPAAASADERFFRLEGVHCDRATQSCLEEARKSCEDSGAHLPTPRSAVDKEDLAAILMGGGYSTVFVEISCKGNRPQWADGLQIDETIYGIEGKCPASAATLEVVPGILHLTPPGSWYVMPSCERRVVRGGTALLAWLAGVMIVLMILVVVVIGRFLWVWRKKRNVSQDGDIQLEDMEQVGS